MFLKKVAEFEQLRLISAPLPPGAAPATSSDSFRSRPCDFRPKAKRWDAMLSTEGRLRCDSTLKATSRGLNPSTTISLGTARPASQYYPWESMTTTSANAVIQDGSDLVAPAGSMSCMRGETAYDLAVALNYGNATGSPQLLRFVTEHVELIHNPPYADWETSLTCGTTSALEIVFRMLCDRGDFILTEEYTYPGAVEASRPLGLSIVGVEMDGAGLVPESLDSVLRNWDYSTTPKPTVLYTIPSGQNPTGVTQTAERRKAIYRIAEQHDLIIIEDDPYYFLQLGEHLCAPWLDENIAERQEDFLMKLPPSYLSMDVSGRVIRLDTASKILAPGLRCGWITACSQLIEKFLNHTNFSTMAPSGPSQVMMYKLLDESWGHTGFINWLMYLSSEYNRRLHAMVEACRMHLPMGICRWSVPTCGMFLWIEIDYSTHPSVHHPAHIDDSVVGILDIEDRLYVQAKQNGVQVNKGSWFATDTRSKQRLYFRLTFAAAPEGSLEQAVVRFAKAVQDEFLVHDIPKTEQEWRNVPKQDVLIAV